MPITSCDLLCRYMAHGYLQSAGKCRSDFINNSVASLLFPDAEYED
jgi:hypothetical protein